MKKKRVLIAAGAVLLLIVVALISEAWDFVSRVDLTELVSPGWLPRRGYYDIATLVAGTLVISGIAMIIVAFTQSPIQGLLAVGLVVIIQQAESLVLVPVIQGRLISISPVAALLAVLAGSAIGDIPGAILAIPVTAIVMVVIDDVILPWRRMQIGDEPPEAEPGPADAAPA